MSYHAVLADEEAWLCTLLITVTGTAGSFIKLFYRFDTFSLANLLVISIILCTVTKPQHFLKNSPLKLIDFIERANKQLGKFVDSYGLFVFSPDV